MGLLDDFTRGLGLIGSAVTGDTTPLEQAAENTVHNFNRGVRVLGDNAPANVRNIAGNFADDFTRGLGVVADRPSVLPGAIAHAAGDIAMHPIVAAQRQGEAIGNAINGGGSLDDVIAAAPDFAASALGASHVIGGATSLANRALARPATAITDALGTRYTPPSMLSLRREFTHMPVEMGDGSLEFGNMTGGTRGSAVVGGQSARYRQLGEAANDFENAMTSGQLSGAYYPTDRAAFSPAYDMALRRHEVAHGLMSRAAANGDAGGLPLPLRVPAQLQMSGNNTLQGLGLLTDEMAARGAEGGLNRALMFLDRPHSFYSDMIAEKSPLVAALYRYQGIPRGVTGAAAAAGAGGGYMLGNQLQGR